VKKDAVFSIKGLHQADDQEPDEVMLTTEGRFYRKGGSYYLMYDESEVTGFEDSRTTVKVSDGSVTVTRSGKYPSMLTFDQGKRHMGMYNTEYGGITISVNTRAISSSLTDDGGSVSVDYDIEFQHAYMSSNSLSIDVRTK